MEKINELVTNKEFEQAKKIIESLNVGEANNIELLKLLGLCNVNLNLFKEAQSNFETVVKYCPDDAVSLFYLGSCYDNQNDFIPAIAAYKEVIKLRENYMDAYKNLCIIYIKNKETENAVELGKRALELVQDDYAFYYIVGTAYMAVKDFTNSVHYFEKAIELNSSHPQLYNNLGTSYVTIGNMKKAFENYKMASELDPGNSLTYFNIASILQAQSKHKEACKYFRKAYEIEPQESYLVAWALSEVRSEDFESAISHYKLLITQYPEKPTYQYNLAVCYESIGEYTYAVGILTHLVMLNPKSILMSQKLANIYMKIDKPLNAKMLYEKIVLQGNVSPEIYYEYANACFMTGDWDTAEKLLKKVIELKPDFALAHKDLGVIYLSRRLFDYAKDEFEQAYEYEPYNFSVVFEYANFLHSTREFEKSDELYQKALEINPDDKNALGFSALNKIHLKDFDNAAAQAEKAIEKAFDESFPYYAAGRIQFAKQDYEAAKQYLIRAYELQKDGDIENLLALCYFELGDYEHACGIFKNLLESSPSNVNLMINIAKSYEKLSEASAALEYLEKAIEIFPDCEEAHEMIRGLS